MSKNKRFHTKNILKMQRILYSGNKSELTLLLRPLDFISVFPAVRTGERPPSILIARQFSAQSLQARDFLLRRPQVKPSGRRHRSDVDEPPLQSAG